ncbi:MAG: hypothetical protein R3190_05795, partial [Thermoanaerobaculia bacterium]|nr:hypothetical protein [Thermoanaerobaculia bacterium]
MSVLLDKILAHLDIQVEGFALCDVREGWCLELAPPPNVVLHFVLAGHGEMKVPGAANCELSVNRLALVPAGV